MPPDRLSALLHRLSRRTGLEFDAKSFDSRLRIQKAVYLLKALHHPVGAGYRFSNYFHGPYSPGLARDYYAIRSPREGSLDPEWTNERHLAIVAEVAGRGNDFLEAAATIHSFSEKNRFQPKENLRTTFDAAKPRLRHHFEEAWAFLKEHQLVASTWTPTS